ncbi:MAG: DUF1501 domain-containing protein [Planctomycetes bacterium]|nr:DUF1501 domain-containing protein [Planctomycetota bacterium]
MNTIKQTLNKSRRNFLRVGAAGAGALALGALDSRVSPLSAKPAKAAALPAHKRLIVINMLGGNDGLNTVFPVTGSVASIYQANRPTIGYTPGQGLSLTGGPGVSAYEIHPSLVNIQSLWNQGDAAFVHKVGYPSQNLSHFVSEDIWSYGARNGLASLPSMAPGWLARFGNNHAPTSMGLVSIGVGRRLDFEGSTANPFLVNSVSSFAYDTDWHYSNNHTLRKEVAQNILSMQPATGLRGEIASAAEAAYNAAAQVGVAATDYATYETTNSIQYPLRPGSTTSLTNMGRRMRDISLLIYGGFDTSVFYTGIGGFDTHSDQAARHAQLLQEIDDAIGVFYQDISIQDAAFGTASDRIWPNLTIVIISEFGRRNYENGSDGTDHGHGSCVTVLGGPVNGGIYGDSLLDADLNAEYLPYTTDFRDIYRSLLGANHMGLNTTELAAIFPEAQPINTTINVV